MVYDTDNADLIIAARDFAKAYEVLARVIHEDNVKKGFWPEGGRIDRPGDTPIAGRRNVGEALMLVVTELSEGMEGDRKGKTDEHLPHFDSLTVEIGDGVIRLMDFSYGLCLDVGEAIAQKLLYNRSRPFKHGKKF